VSPDCISIKQHRQSNGSPSAQILRGANKGLINLVETPKGTLFKAEQKLAGF
jgi:hypothetical protein